jgi:diphosphomevalonate decarboxylase
VDDGFTSMKKIIARAPVNIALIKYWGKANTELVLPTTTSLSLTLTDLYTETSFEEGPFQFLMNGKPGDPGEVSRVKDVLKHFRDDRVIIKTANNFPTASGLASSASGFAALTVGLNSFFQAGYTLQELATLTRLGSGSSCRSLLDDFAIWYQNGSIETLPNPFKDLRMIVVLISEAKKAISSRDAMKITMETAPSYQAWIKDSDLDFQTIKTAILNKDFVRVGETMEKNSARLHQVMADSTPPILYQQPESHKVLKMVSTLRQQGLIGYATMDAGPNVKILIQGKDLSKWEEHLKKTLSVKYLITRMGGKAYAQ